MRVRVAVFGAALIAVVVLLSRPKDHSPSERAQAASAGSSMLGGFKQVDDFANHAGVEGARAASEKYLAEHQGVSGPVEVLSVQTQVVAGTNYKLKLKAGGKTFEATVWEKLPHAGGAFEVTSMKESGGQGAGAGGAPEWHDNPEVDDAAAYAVQQLSSQSNSLFPFTLKKVLSATVSKREDGGVTHHLKLQLSHGTMPDTVYEFEVENPGGSYQLKSSQQVKSG